MDKVTMTHPSLPGQPIQVFPSAVAVHETSGWRVGSEPAPAEESAIDPTPAETSLPAKSATKSEWERAARDAGLTDDQIAGMTKDELITELTGTKE